MSESTTGPEKGPLLSPELPAPVSQDEVKETMMWMEGKSPSEIATELVRWRQQAILGGIDVITEAKNLIGVMGELTRLKATALRNVKENIKEEKSPEESLPTQILILEADLDELKKVNDTEGRAAGNDLLRRANNALLLSTRGDDVGGRVGGDEFAVVALVRNLAEGKKIKERVRGNMENNKVEASIGYVVWTEGEDFLKALDRADGEMKKDKQERKKGRV